MKDFTNISAAQDTGVAYNEGLRQFMIRIYNYMGIALILTGVLSYGASQSDAFMGAMLKVQDGYKVPTMWFYVVSFAPLLPWAVYFFSRGRLSYQKTHMIFWSFAALMGLSMFSIFHVYEIGSIVKVFFMSAAIFGGMSLYGYTTKRDLSGIGSFLIMGMWGIFIALIVNMFLKSPVFDYAISVIGALIFTGLAAYTTQELKRMYLQVQGNAEAVGKMAVMGAMTLYINFINLFIFLLRLFGDRR